MNIASAARKSIARPLVALAVAASVFVPGTPGASAASSQIGGCQTLGSPSSYTLTSDLTVVDATCFVITASGVTLNLNGHTITCTGSGFAGSCQIALVGPTGVRVMPGLTAVAVKGPGTLNGFDNGVFVDNSNAAVTGLTVTGPACDPNDCQRPVSNGLGVTGHLNPDGTVDSGAAAVNISGNRVTNYGRGIALIGAACPGGSAGCAVKNNVVHDGSGEACQGILLSGVSDYVLNGNQTHGNGYGDCFPPAGIAVGDGSTGNTLTNNDASDNLGFGIGVGPGTNGNTITNNTARGNALTDLQGFPGTDNQWNDNNVCNTEGGAVPPTVCNPGE